MGSYYCTFAVTLPGSSSPTIGSFYGNRIDGDVPAGWGVYVQGKSKIQLVISAASGSSGSSISSYRFNGGGYSWSSSVDNAYTTGYLTSAGSNTFTGTVTDSRGYTTSQTFSVNVEAYEPPAATTLSIFRSLVSGVQSETGAYIAIKLTTAYSSVGGRNTLNIRAAHRKVGTSEWSAEYSITGGGFWLLNAGLLSTDTALYEVRLRLYDSLSSITQIYDVTGAQYTMHFARGGQNVSIGMAGSRVNALEINPTWGLYHGNVDLIAKINGTGGVTPIIGGGTGATTAAGALTNLGAAAASHAHTTGDITSGVLSVLRGGTGTGALTANRALITDAYGNVSTSSSSSSQLGLLANVTSDIQTQLNGKTSHKVQYGSTYVDGNYTATIYFSGFSYTPYVVACYSTTGFNWSGDNGAIKIYNKSAYSANIIIGRTFPTSRQIDWIAVGI